MQLPPAARAARHIITAAADWRKIVRRMRSDGSASRHGPWSQSSRRVEERLGLPAGSCRALFWSAGAGSAKTGRAGRWLYASTFPPWSLLQLPSLIAPPFSNNLLRSSVQSARTSLHWPFWNPRLDGYHDSFIIATRASYLHSSPHPKRSRHRHHVTLHPP
jgi:hypothetical protein